MTCELWRDQIEMYVDGELASAHESEIARHLRSCADCTAFAADAIHLKRVVSDAGNRYKPSAEFREQLVKSIGARDRFRFPTFWQLAAVSVVLIAVILGTFAFLKQGSNLDREISDIHLSTIASANPVDVISTDQHTVKPWFQGKVPFTFNLPDLTNSPFTLVGGRMVYVRNTPTALLLFQYKLHKISVLIGPSSVLGEGEQAKQSANGFHEVRWTNGGRTYITISDASAEQVKDLSQRMKTVE